MCRSGAPKHAFSPPVPANPHSPWRSPHAPLLWQPTHAPLLWEPTQKHKTQLNLLKSRNPKRERKMAKRKAALERASEKEQATLALIQEEHMMAEDVKPKKQQQEQQPPKSKGKGKKKGKKGAAGDGDEMEE